MSLTFLPEIREIVCLRVHECLEIDGFFKPHYLKKVLNKRAESVRKVVYIFIVHVYTVFESMDSPYTQKKKVQY